MPTLVSRASMFNEASAGECLGVDEWDEALIKFHFHTSKEAHAVPRNATRRFHIEENGFPFEWEMEWPDPSSSADLQMNLYDYYQSYVLVCPGCGAAWCRSQCNKPPDNLWSVRPRWCADCLEAYVAYQRRIHEGRMIVSCHCPGTVLSFDDRLLGEGGDHYTWEACFFALPEPMLRRELKLWCAFDLLCNPLKETPPT